MGKRMYEIGLLVKASEAENDFETVEWEDDLERVADARKKAKEISRKCPFKDWHGREIVAADVTCHSDEEEEMGSNYWVHWREVYVNGKLAYRLE